MAGVFQDFDGRLLGTAGTELELLLIDPASGELVSAASRVLETAGRTGGLNGTVTPEFHADMIEVKTEDGGAAVDQFQAAVVRKIQLLLRAAQEAGCVLLPAARHLNPNRLERPLFEDRHSLRFPNHGPRYRQLMERYPILREGIAGHSSVQFHIGLPMNTPRQRDTAVMVADAATALAGVKIACAANSPNFGGNGAYLDCSRQADWIRLPRGGPFFYGTWSDLIAHADELRRRGEIRLMTELWYMERFNRQTLESRGMDEQPDMEHLFELWAFVHSLHLALWRAIRVAGFAPKIPALKEFEESLPSVFGPGLTDPEQVPVWNIFEGGWTSLADIFGRLVDFAMPAAEDHNLHGDLARFQRRVEDGQNGSALQRRWHQEEGGNVLAVYKRAARHFADSVGEYGKRLRLEV